MPKKSDKTTEEENKTPEIVKVTVENKHLTSPHWIELRRSEAEVSGKPDEKFFVEARLHDTQFSIAIGSMTVETVLRENGASPMLHGDEQLEISFSPYTGEIISIVEKKAEVEKLEVAV